MAGLGETCSHAASLLWATTKGVEKRDSLMVNQKSAYLIMPRAIKTVPYAPLAEISFVGKKQKKVIITEDTPVDTTIMSKRKARYIWKLFFNQKLAQIDVRVIDIILLYQTTFVSN